MPDSDANPVAARFAVRANLWSAGVFCLALLLLYHETTWSMVSIWLRSETFAHGFLILPISLWMIWHQRDRLRAITSGPVWWVSLLIIPPGFVWLLAWLVEVSVVKQLALVTMLVLGAWAVMGHQLARTLAFPLLFLFLAVPMGEGLIPPMMEFTATSTVWLIQKTGIPVYREGLYFTLPSGRWSVVEACSGVRYIIASVTLGVLYAYLTYVSKWRRLAFVLASAIVPVFANTARAYIIVMLGHMSSMEIATGADHLIYGWVFFGIVVFVLFWIGSFFREDQQQTVDPVNSVQVGASPGLMARRFIAVTLLCLLLAGIWPAVQLFIARPSGAITGVSIRLPQTVEGWTATPSPLLGWEPSARASGQVIAHYAGGGDAVSLIVQYAADEAEEVLGSSTKFVDKDSGWRVRSASAVAVNTPGNSVVVDQAEILGRDGALLVWSWYRIGENYTSNDYRGKLFEARLKLGSGADQTYRIVLATPISGQVESAQDVLQSFLNAYFQELEQALDSESQGQE